MTRLIPAMRPHPLPVKPHVLPADAGTSDQVAPRRLRPTAAGTGFVDDRPNDIDRPTEEGMTGPLFTEELRLRADLAELGLLGP